MVNWLVFKILDCLGCLDHPEKCVDIGPDTELPDPLENLVLASEFRQQATTITQPPKRRLSITCTVIQQ